MEQMYSLSGNRIKSLCFLLLIFVSLYSCTKDKEEDNRYVTTPYNIEVPAGFPPIKVQTEITVEGVRLGRMLYYDPILSSNGRSCSSCHQQAKAFSIPVFTHLNSDKTSVPAHINLAWKEKFLWEGAFLSIEEVCIVDFEPEFFNTNMDVLVERLVNHNDYPRLFFEAFNIRDISKLSHLQLKQNIVTAIAQFVNTFVSANSRYDKYRNGELMLDPDEMRGNIIFNTEEGDCFHCHGSMLLTDNKVHNNGLEESPAGQDLGLYNYTNVGTDAGKFLAPTLRNIEFTAPYMHDGRYQTLEEVVEFYNSGVHLNSPNIDPIMTKPFKLSGLHLSPYDKDCLVKFLKTFSDSSFINNPAYASPF